MSTTTYDIIVISLDRCSNKENPFNLSVNFEFSRIHADYLFPSYRKLVEIRVIFPWNKVLKGSSMHQMVLSMSEAIIIPAHALA